MCRTLGLTRSSYYDWLRRQQRPDRDALLTARIVAIHASSDRTYGSPRVLAALREAGERVSRKRVARLMRAAALEGQQRRRFRVATTDSAHAYPIAPNRLGEQTVPVRPDQVWVSDITYVPTDEGWLYLAGVMDRASRRLIGWATGPTLESSLPSAALAMALSQRGNARGVVHHSDRGSQYASTGYRDLLDQHGLIASMSRRGNCYDNAAMESFWSTLKHELVSRYRFRTRAEATQAIFRYIEGFYNRRRLHSALGYKSPLDYEQSLN